MKWEEVLNHDQFTLNLGGRTDCHPAKNYEHHISVDLDSPDEPWRIQHNITERIPLPDNSVPKIISEHFFEHIKETDVVGVLTEAHRILKPGGTMRIAVPDYMHPKNSKYLKTGHDPRHTDHLYLPTYKHMEEFAKKSPFQNYKLYHYWTEEDFVHNEVDYSRGWIKRTPDNDFRNFRNSLGAKIGGVFEDFFFLLSRGFMASKKDLSTQRGHPYRVTSIILDLEK